MVKFKYGFIFLCLNVLILNACVQKKEHVNRSGSWLYQKVEPTLIVDYLGESHLEQRALNRIKQYLKESELDRFYIVAFVYPDTIANQQEFESEPYIGVEIIHAITLKFLNNLEQENSQLLKKHDGDDLPLIIPPPTGNVSGMDRTIFYYQEKDSLADLLSH
jgi:hypothetical protein